MRGTNSAIEVATNHYIVLPLLPQTFLLRIPLSSLDKGFSGHGIERLGGRVPVRETLLNRQGLP